MIEQRSTLAKQAFSEAMRTCSTICAILVLFIHSYNISVYNTVSNPVIYWIQEVISEGLARGAVPFFFMSSAFFLYSGNKSTGEVYKSRFKSLVIPYLLWNTIFMILFTALKMLHLSDVGLDRISPVGILKGIFLHDYHYAYWYMLYLIVITAMYPLIKWVISRNKLVCFSVLALMVVAYICGINRLDSLIYYYLGAVVGFYYKNQAEAVTQLSQKRSLLIMAGLLVMGTLLFLATNVWEQKLELPRNIVVVLLLVFLVAGFKLKTAKWLAALSFMIYSVHPIILESVEKVIYMILPHNALWMMVDYVVAPAVTLGMIIGGCMLLKKLLPKVYAVLNGGRP